VQQEAHYKHAFDRCMHGLSSCIATLRPRQRCGNMQACPTTDAHLQGPQYTAVMVMLAAGAQGAAATAEVRPLYLRAETQVMQCMHPSAECIEQHERASWRDMRDEATARGSWDANPARSPAWPVHTRADLHQPQHRGSIGTSIARSRAAALWTRATLALQAAAATGARTDHG
jgi:hypothetical protein